MGYLPNSSNSRVGSDESERAQYSSCKVSFANKQSCDASFLVCLFLHFLSNSYALNQMYRSKKLDDSWKDLFPTISSGSAVF